MGEIDRVQPIQRPVAAPRAAERIHPDSDRRQAQHESKEDELELSNTAPQEEPEIPDEPVAEPPQHGLDLSI